MFERQIVRMPVNGVVRPVIMTSGKQAIYDVIDAETGKWIYSKDLGLQNIVSSIDPVTGKKNMNPHTLPGDGQTQMVCPARGRRQELDSEFVQPGYEDLVYSAGGIVHGSDAGARGRTRGPFPPACRSICGRGRIRMASTAAWKPSTW